MENFKTQLVLYNVYGSVLQNWTSHKFYWWLNCCVFKLNLLHALQSKTFLCSEQKSIIAALWILERIDAVFQQYLSIIITELTGQVFNLPCSLIKQSFILHNWNRVWLHLTLDCESILFLDLELYIINHRYFSPILYFLDLSYKIVLPIVF